MHIPVSKMGKVRDVGIHTLNHPAAIAFFAEEIVVKCEVKPDEDIYIYIKAFRLKAIVKIYILCSFCKARDIFQKFWMSETTQKKSLQKIWRVEFVENSPVKR